MTHGLLQLAVIVAAFALRCDGLIINATEARPKAKKASANTAGIEQYPPSACQEGALEFDGVLFPCPVSRRGADAGAGNRSLAITDAPPVGLASHMTKSFIPSWVALGLGSLLYLFGKPGLQSTAAIFVLYFGAQTFLNFYMKSTLSGFQLSSAHTNLRGMPAPFLVTAIQQLISFVIVVSASFLSRPTRWKFSLGFNSFTRKKCLFILCLSLSFTLNIGLNSLALCVLDISVNLTIRALGPLATAFLQQTKAWLFKEGLIDVTWGEMALLTIGTLSAALAVLAKTIFVDNRTNFENTVAGTIICIASLAAASSELIIVGMMGEEMKMNPVEVIACTCIPSMIFLALPFCFLPHPTPWQDTGLSTDLFVAKVIFELNPMMFALALYSGIFAVIYNGLLYTCVQRFSPIQAALASNTNKAGTIILGMLLGAEKFPHGICGVLLTIGIVFNISSFAMYALVKTWRKQGEQKATKDEQPGGEHTQASAPRS